MDPDPAQDPNPTPDLTPFFSDFEDAKTNFFSHFFLITYPQAHYTQVLKIKFFPKILKASYQSAQQLYEKREGSGAGSGSIPRD